MIQFNISSSFSSSQIYLFITPLLSHLSHIRGQGNMQNFPQCCIVKQCNYTDGERNNKKITPNKPKMLLLTDFFVRFSSNKSLSTTEYFLMVIKNNWMGF